MRYFIRQSMVENCGISICISKMKQDREKKDLHSCRMSLIMHNKTPYGY